MSVSPWMTFARSCYIQAQKKMVGMKLIVKHLYTHIYIFTEYNYLIVFNVFKSCFLKYSMIIFLHIGHLSVISTTLAATARGCCEEALCEQGKICRWSKCDEDCKLHQAANATGFNLELHFWKKMSMSSPSHFFQVCL